MIVLLSREVLFCMFAAYNGMSMERTMSVMLIIYEPGKMNRAIDPVPGIIEEYNHVQLSESTYAIETYEKTRTVLNVVCSSSG